MSLAFKFLCWLLFFNVSKTIAYNQPKLSSCVWWNVSAVTFASVQAIGIMSYEAFIDNDNVAHIIGYINETVFVWPINHTSPTRRILGAITRPVALFVDDQRDIYLSHSPGSSRIDRWSLNATAGPETIWFLPGECWGLFIDIAQNLYCAMKDQHQIRKKSINSSSTNTSTTVAGTGCAGSRSNMLTYPYGIFVDAHFNLYVADSGNNRIQRFSSNQTNGTTLAGTGAPNTIELNSPRDVALDGNDYLFIIDSYNHRIVGSGPNGFRCIFGCFGVNAPFAQRLWYPHSISFDTSGNIFVADRGWSRVQKILLASNHCETETTTHLPTIPIENFTVTTLQDDTSTDLSVKSSSITPTAIPATTLRNVSYNLPKFGPCAAWNQNAVTIINMDMAVYLQQSLFINRNNTVYNINYQTGSVQIWSNGITRTLNVSNKYTASNALFVTDDGDIYIEDVAYNAEIVKLSVDRSRSETIAYVPSGCRGLFIDVANTIYCSMALIHLVVKTSLNSNSTPTVTAAGTGCPGTGSTFLIFPHGIFVDRQFRLYVADSGNHRIQLFLPGSLNGTTIVGSTGRYNITLHRPLSVVLDDDNNIYVVDSNNHRVVYAGPDGTRCIVGCSRINGSASDQLNTPHAMAFDAFGNIYVTDLMNQRVQKFDLASNSCVTTESLITTKGMRSTTRLDSTLLSTISTTVQVHNKTTAFTETPLTTDFISLAFYSTDPVDSNQPCTILKPCLNHGICVDNTTNPLGYTCLCPSYVNGSNCQYNHRLCQPNTCRNNGTCISTSNVEFTCQCTSDWNGVNCERKVDYCANVSCQNEGVCLQLIGEYRCQCIDRSYSGQHCEVISNGLLMKIGFCRSVGYIAVIFLVAVAVFVVVLDVLKYVFHIGPAEKKRLKQRTRLKKKKCRHR